MPNFDIIFLSILPFPLTMYAFLKYHLPLRWLVGQFFGSVLFPNLLFSQKWPRMIVDTEFFYQLVDGWLGNNCNEATITSSYSPPC